MSHSLTESSSFDANIVVPDPSDIRNAASVIAGFQPLANRTRKLKDSLVVSTSGTMQLNLSNAQNNDLSLPSGFMWGLQSWVNFLVSSTAEVSLEFRLPAGVTITQLRAWIVRQGGAHSALPAVKPVLNFYEIDPANATSPPHVNFSASQADGSATVGAYEALHAITLNTSRVVANGYRYLATVTGESGANALANTTTLQGLDVSWTAAF